MTWQVWIGFVAVSAAIGLVPGPAVLSIVGYALGSGLSVALASVAGVALGNAIAITVSLAGVGALLATSAVAFALVKWSGALYLCGLGLWTLIRHEAADDAPRPPVLTPRAAFLGAIAIGTFHPKTIVFFIAFVPQFISPDGDYVTQAAILVATFVTVVGMTDTLYALAAARAAPLLRGRHVDRWSRRTSGGILIVAGIVTGARD